MTETESMVDRVAEAIWQGEWARAGNGGRRRVPWSEIAENDQARYRFIARAAIEAMKDCDNDILEAMWCAMFQDKFTGSELPMLNAGWVAALVKALEE